MPKSTHPTAHRTNAEWTTSPLSSVPPSLTFFLPSLSPVLISSQRKRTLRHSPWQLSGATLF